MEPIQAIFFDIDGTLLDFHTHTISESTINSINKLQEQGIKVALNSSRPWSTIRPIPKIDQIHWDGIVGANGMEVFNENIELIKDKSLSVPQLTQIATIAKDSHIPLYMAGEDAFFTEENEDVYKLIDKYHMPKPKFKAYKGEKQKLLTLITFDKKLVENSFIDMEGITIIDAGPFNVDIFPKGITKGTGALDLMNYWNLENYMCFGDTKADEAMMKEAELSVAMNIASESTKDVADYICPTDSVDSIEQALQHFHLL